MGHQRTHLPAPHQNSRRHSRLSLRGLTIGELATTCALLGILALIALISYNGHRDRAHDAAAHSTLRNSALAARTGIHDLPSPAFPGPLTADLLAQLAAIEPGLLFTEDQSTGPNQISTSRLSSERLILAALSESGTCWLLSSRLDGSASYASHDVATAPCQADAVDPAGITGPSFTDAPEIPPTTSTTTTTLPAATTTAPTTTTTITSTPTTTTTAPANHAPILAALPLSQPSVPGL